MFQYTLDLEANVTLISYVYNITIIPKGTRKEKGIKNIMNSVLEDLATSIDALRNTNKETHTETYYQLNCKIAGMLPSLFDGKPISLMLLTDTELHTVCVSFRFYYTNTLFLEYKAGTFRKERRLSPNTWKKLINGARAILASNKVKKIDFNS